MPDGSAPSTTRINAGIGANPEGSGSDVAVPGSASNEANSDGPASGSPLPTADSTTTRTTVAWWLVFVGPIVLVLAMAFAGATVSREAPLWVFTLGVSAFTLTLGLAAVSRKSLLWWLVPVAISFVAAGIAVGLIDLLDAAADRMRDSP